MHGQRNNSSSAMKSQSNTMPRKENDSSPEAKLKVKEYCNLTDKEFKIGVLKKFIELWENSERQFSELRNKINDQKEYFTEDIETLRKNQEEILELKNSINNIKNALESTGNTSDHMEERISELEDRNLEMMQVEEGRELRYKKWGNSMRAIQPFKKGAY